jgi:hypothetical protein
MAVNAKLIYLSTYNHTKIYLSNEKEQLENFLMLTKFHLFHYFSRLSFSGELDFQPVKELLQITIENHMRNLA